MAILPAPNLDDLTFQDIVDDAKRKIGLLCPEWTEHNVSDPGVTLIELFAWMIEGTLYRLNQVPDRNYIKFLEMLGISLEPPTPAQTDLRFRLSQRIEDVEGAREIELPARHTVAATVRTEFAEAVEFSTDATLRMVRPRLAHVVALPAPDDGGAGAERPLPEWPDGTRFLRHEGENLLPEPREGEAQGRFAIFSDTPMQNDTLLLGFESDVAGNLIELECSCVATAATGLEEDYPAQVWEWFSEAQERWERLEVVEDTTRGFNRNGRVELALPTAMTQRDIGGRRACWVRCRYTRDLEDLPPRPGPPPSAGEDPRPPAAYQASPLITGLITRTTGGTAPSSNSIAIVAEELGQGDGTAGQVFILRNRPVLPRAPGETVRVGALGAPIEEMEEWKEVQDFSESGPNDRHFTLDSLSGEIRFGPSVRQTDGTLRQYGKPPEKGMSVLFVEYRCGGGTHANVQENEIRVLKSSIPYVSDVWNPRRASGGGEQESLDHAKLRAQSLLRMRDRAVTTEDFAFLAARASPGVGLARCLSPDEYPEGKPGTVYVLVVPSLPASDPVPQPRHLVVPERTLAEVRAYLRERCLLTTVIEVREPEYVFVSTDITLMAQPDADPDLVRRRVRERLERFLHPLSGGPDGKGWPVGATLTLAHLYAQIQQAPGAGFLLGTPRLLQSRLADPQAGVLGREQEVPLDEGLLVQPNQVLCTREHRVIVRPLIGQRPNAR